MKNRLTIILLLFFILSLDGTALALELNGSSAFKADGVNAVQHRRSKRPKQKKQPKAKVYGMKVTPGEAGAPPSPPPPPPPAQEEMPTMAAPPVQASPGSAAPGGGPSNTPAKKSAPRIKPPTVMIKPPTE